MAGVTGAKADQGTQLASYLQIKSDEKEEGQPSMQGGSDIKSNISSMDSSDYQRHSYQARRQKVTHVGWM